MEKSVDIKRPGKILHQKPAAEPAEALVTVITIYDSAQKYLEQTVYSVINQTFPWFEWMMIEAGSSRKGISADLARFQKMDSRIRILRHSGREAAGAWDAAVKKAGADIIVPLGAGDMVSPQYLEYIYFGFYFHKNAVRCWTDMAVFEQKIWKARRLQPWDFPAVSAFRKQDAAKAAGNRKRETAEGDRQQKAGKISGNAKKHCGLVHLKGYFYWKRRAAGGVHAAAGYKDMRRNAGGTAQAVSYPVRRAAEPYRRPDPMEHWERYGIRTDGKKARLLMVIPWLVMGGADKFNLDLAAGLARRNFAISVVTTVPSENEWQKYFLEYTDEIFHLPDFLDPEHYVEFVSYYIRTRNIDILFVSNSYRGYYMLPLLRKQFPKLCIIDYVHMEEWYWKAGGYARLSGMFGAFLEKTYVCNSGTHKVMTSCFRRAAESVEIMYIGVDEKRFDEEKVKEGYLYRTLSQKLGISGKRPIILFPCRICAQKRPFLMLAAAEKLCRQRPDVLFVVVGDGPQKKALEKAAAQRRLGKHIVFLGRMEHMERCYRDAKVTLICSVKEGLSLTAYESCAMGTPVVSSDAGGQKDLVDDTVGRLIPLRQSETDDFGKRRYQCREVDAYVDALLKLLTDEEHYQACSQNCRRKIMQGFTVQNMLEHMETEMDRLARDQGMAEKRMELSLRIQQLGFLAEELYTSGLAEEERSLGSHAALEMLEKAFAAFLPEGSMRRELAVQLYRKWR